MKKKHFMKFIALFLIPCTFCFLSETPAKADDSNDLVISYIESRPLEDKIGYDVSALFSLLDSSGNPIKDLELENVTISEDGKSVSPLSLDLTTDQPIYITLLLDTSGSMRGSKNEALISASNEFIKGLNDKDRISITTFNDQIKNLIDFSTDHNAVASLVSSISAVPGSGTCLNDAIYEAVQKIAALPMGRRAVIILTDGKDESPNGGPCSKLTIDDVIRLATEGHTSVPVFSIGIGDTVDDAGLSRIAKLTGGIYSSSPKTDQLTATFNRLLELLQTEYILRYTSTSAPGSHTLVLNINYLNELYTDSRDFMLLGLPIRISFLTPISGQEITDKVLIVTSISGEAEPIKQVIFKANGITIGVATNTPYELEWQPGADVNGNVTLSAVVIGENDNEITKDEVQVVVSVPEKAVVPNENKRNFEEQGINYYLYGGLLAGFFAVAILLIFVIRRKKSEEKKRDKRWHDTVVNPPDNKKMMDEMTIDGFTFSPNSLGALSVLQSDDPAMIGQTFAIVENATRLGRAADNEILFPKDSTVSRHHAIIENRNGQLTLSEMVSTEGDGSVKKPTFGTYINDFPLTYPTILHNGDVIKLGKRVLLRFASADSEMADDAKTQDLSIQEDVDKTIDAM